MHHDNRGHAIFLFQASRPCKSKFGSRGGLVSRPTAQVVTWGSKNPRVDPQDLKGREKLTQPMANLTKLMGVPYLVGKIWKIKFKL